MPIPNILKSMEQPGRSDFQALDDLSADDMLVDDFIDVFRIDIGVPGALRINDQHRAFFAAIQAAGLVDPHLALAVQIEFLDAPLRMLLRRLGAARSAAGPAVIAFVDAEKDVLLVKGLVGHCGIQLIRRALPPQRMPGKALPWEWTNDTPASFPLQGMHRVIKKPHGENGHSKDRNCAAPLKLRNFPCTQPCKLAVK